MNLRFLNHKNEFIPISLILISGTFLRFWDFGSIPFTHDEFSALLRTQYSNFSDLIRNGVIPDGHPAGIQTFLYFWVKIFGFSEFWVKLPFALMGILSIWYLYLIAKKWFSDNTALLATSSMAFMQYFVMYSQIARPYISGVFFTLVMIFYWHKILFESLENKTKRIKYIIGFTLGATLCNYNHYFSMMMTVLASAIGFIYLNKRNYKSYIASLFLIALLFVPHLKIFFYHLGSQGLGWLGAPTPAFIIDFLSYLFHFNVFLLFGVLIFFIVSLLFYIKNRKSLKKEHIIVFVLSIVPFSVGFLYSIYRAPVLQFSVLIFSVPFLFMFLFSFSDVLKSIWSKAITLIWSLLLIFTLIFQREHYKFFYHSIYEETFHEINSFSQNYSKYSTLVVCNFRKEIGDFYTNKSVSLTNIDIIYPGQLNSKREIYQKMEDVKYKYLIFNTVTNGDFDFFAVAKEYFSVIEKKVFLNGGEIWILSRGTPNYSNQYVYLDENKFKTPSIWSFDSSAIVKNDTNYYIVDSTKEYDVQYSLYLDEKIKSNGNIIDVSAWIFLPENFNKDAHLVASVEKDSVLLWQGRNINKNDFSINKWHAISVSIFLPDAKFKIDSCTLKIYFWNPNHETFFVKKTSVGIRKVNPAVYWVSNALGSF